MRVVPIRFALAALVVMAGCKPYQLLKTAEEARTPISGDLGTLVTNDRVELSPGRAAPWSADGTELFYVSPDYEHSNVSIKAVRLATGNVRTLTTISADIRTLVQSADRSAIYFIATALSTSTVNLGLYRIKTSGDSLRRILADPALENAWDFAMSPDGRYFAMDNRLIDLQSGQTRGRVGRPLSFSPSGASLAWFSNAGLYLTQEGVEIETLSNGQVRRVWTADQPPCCPGVLGLRWDGESPQLVLNRSIPVTGTTYHIQLFGLDTRSQAERSLASYTAVDFSSWFMLSTDATRLATFITSPDCEGGGQGGTGTCAAPTYVHVIRTDIESDVVVGRALVLYGRPVSSLSFSPDSHRLAYVIAEHLYVRALP